MNRPNRLPDTSVPDKSLGLHAPKAPNRTFVVAGFPEPARQDFRLSASVPDCRAVRRRPLPYLFETWPFPLFGRRIKPKRRFGRDDRPLPIKTSSRRLASHCKPRTSTPVNEKRLTGMPGGIVRKPARKRQRQAAGRDGYAHERGDIAAGQPPVRLLLGRLVEGNRRRSPPLCPRGCPDPAWRKAWKRFRPDTANCRALPKMSRVRRIPAFRCP